MLIYPSNPSQYSMKQKVNVFFIGEAKSGTTTLFELCNRHPQVFCPQAKEPRYFCTDFYTHPQPNKAKARAFPFKSLAEYESIYVSAKKETHLVDASVQYAYSTVAAKEIHTYNKDAKIIYVIREPVSFLHSLHSSQATWFEDDIIDFEKALAYESKRKKENIYPRTSTHPEAIHYSDRVNYYQHIKNYFDVFPQKSILVLTLDELKKNEKETLQKIISFLEIKPFAQTTKDVHQNENVQLRAPGLVGLIKKLHLNTLVQYLPFRTSIERLYLRVFHSKAKRDPISAESREKIKIRYKPMVVKLNAYLHEKKAISTDLLKLWKY